MKRATCTPAPSLAGVQTCTASVAILGGDFNDLRSFCFESDASMDKAQLAEVVLGRDTYGPSDMEGTCWQGLSLRFS